MKEVHEGICYNHSGGNALAKKILRTRYCWPTMEKDVHEYIRECMCQKDKSTVVHNAIFLYKMSSIAPKWAKSMVEYMTTNVMPKKMSKV